MDNQSDLKHLVIVGGSFAGLILLYDIASHFRVTLIEKKDHFEWICMMPKSILNKEGYFENEANVSLREAVEVNKVFGDKVTFVQGILTEVVDAHSLKVKRTVGLDDGSSLDSVEEETIDFDFLALCTGGDYTVNESEVQKVHHIFSKEKRQEFLQSYQNQIDEANSVLVVGGGATGCETVGELLIQYGNTKKLGIMDGTERLMFASPQEASQKIHDEFEKQGVNIYTNTKYSADLPVVQEYDLVIKCFGKTFYTPFFDNEYFKESKDSRGRIFVNKYFQVTEKHPICECTFTKVHPNIFCYGDACLTRANEAKNIPNLKEMFKTISHNLKESLKDEPQFEEIREKLDNSGGLYYGKEAGLYFYADQVYDKPDILTVKKYYQDTYLNLFKNAEGGKEAYDKFMSGG